MKLCQPDISAAIIILGGVGGDANSGFTLKTATNVAIPTGLWTPILTNQFDQYGVFEDTNTFDPNEPQRFFLLEQESP